MADLTGIELLEHQFNEAVIEAHEAYEAYLGDDDVAHGLGTMAWHQYQQARKRLLDAKERLAASRAARDGAR